MTERRQLIPAPRARSAEEQGATSVRPAERNAWRDAFLGAPASGPGVRQVPLVQQVERGADAVAALRQPVPYIPPGAQSIQDNPMVQQTLRARGAERRRAQFMRENPDRATPAERSNPFPRIPDNPSPIQYNLGSREPTPMGAQVPREGRALLDLISEFEGTNRYANRGYNTLVGGNQIADLSAHPRQVGVTTADGPSRAFGRYQFVPGTWDMAARQLGLTDMSPESQDRAGWWLAQRAYRASTGRELGTDLADPQRWDGIASALGNEWASFPGQLGRNQRQHDIGTFRTRLQTLLGDAAQREPRHAREFLGLDRGTRSQRRPNFEQWLSGNRARDRAIPTNRRAGGSN